MNRNLTKINKTLICVVLRGSLIMFGTASLAAQSSPNNTTNSSQQLDTQARAVKNQVIKIGQGSDITIIGKNNREFYGSIREIKDDSVSINEIDQKGVIEIKYTDIKKVRKDYESARAINGNRIRPRKHLIGILVGAAAILIPIIILASSKD